MFEDIPEEKLDEFLSKLEDSEIGLGKGKKESSRTEKKGKFKKTRDRLSKPLHMRKKSRRARGYKRNKDIKRSIYPTINKLNDITETIRSMEEESSFKRSSKLKDIEREMKKGKDRKRSEKKTSLRSLKDIKAELEEDLTKRKSATKSSKDRDDEKVKSKLSKLRDKYVEEKALKKAKAFLRGKGYSEEFIQRHEDIIRDKVLDILYG